MKLIDIPVDNLREAPWNPNRMDEATFHKLRMSIDRFGLVENLVVRPLAGGMYEVLSGNQRLQLLREMGLESAPCVVVDLDDAHARLLAQALNRVQGEDDLGLKAGLLKTVLDSLSQEEVLSILPETASSLQALASMNQDTIADYLKAYEQAQAARLKHLQFQLTPAQLETVDEALQRILPAARQNQRESPNARGTALYLLCKAFLEKERDLP